MLLSTPIVYVSGQFWQIPIFIRAYLHFPGYGAPEVLNHVMVAFMAFILIVYSNFRLDRVNGLILVGNLILDFVVLWTQIYIVVDVGWPIRVLTLCSLGYIFLREAQKNGCSLVHA